MTDRMKASELAAVLEVPLLWVVLCFGQDRNAVLRISTGTLFHGMTDTFSDYSNSAYLALMIFDNNRNLMGRQLVLSCSSGYSMNFQGVNQILYYTLCILAIEQ